MLTEALLFGAVAWVIWRLFIWEENPIDTLPGPPCLPIVGNAWQLLRIDTSDSLNQFVAYTTTYGERFKLQVLTKRVIIVSGPQDIELVLNHSKNIQKSMPYRFLEPWLGSGLLLSTGSHWHKRRKILTPTFHFNILKNFATIIEEKSRDLVTLLKQKNGEEVDLMPVISYFTLLTICETAMGTKLDGDHSSESKKYKDAILSIGETILKRLMRVWMHSDIIFNMSSDGKKFYENLSIARTFAEKVIIDRKANRIRDGKLEAVGDDIGTKKRLAMLDLLLEAEEKGEIHMDGIKDEVNTFMFEGHDTTALALTFGLMLIADHEEVQDRLYEECRKIFGDSDRVPSMSDLSDMKYLEAVIKETLRLYPSVPFIGREIVEDFMLGDLPVKKDTTVDIHFYELHRREDLFPEPEVFKPERFLSGEMKHPYAYVPFSAGPRNCIGQRFAMQEMKCVLSEIIRNFKMVPKVKGYRPKIILDLVLRPVEPIYVKFIQRENIK